MTLQPFTNEELNYFKFAHVVLDEFPRALRQTFKAMWDNTFGHLPGFQLWDDSVAVRNMFLAKEGGTTKVPTHLSYNQWDCTALFQATIFARSFALPDSTGHHRTLSNLFVRPRGLPHGSFHASVISPVANNVETFALAIDQLRLLRNAFCHSSSSKMDRPTFDQYIQHTKDAIGALGLTTDPVDAVGSLTEADFPAQRVRTLEDEMRKELQAESVFLKEDVKDQLVGMKDELVGIRSDIMQLNQESKEDVTRTGREKKEEVQELQNQLREDIRKEHQAQRTYLKKDVKDEMIRIRSDIAQSSQELREDVTQAVRELRKEEIQELHYQLKEDIRTVLQAESALLQEGVKQELQNRRSDIAQSPNQDGKENVPQAAGERKEEYNLELNTEQWKGETLASSMKMSSTADQEINGQVAELKRKFDKVLQDRRLPGKNNGF